MKTQVKYAAELYALSSITLIHLLEECETIPEAIQAIDYSEDKKEQYALEMALLQKKSDEIEFSWACFDTNIGYQHVLWDTYMQEDEMAKDAILFYDYDLIEEEANKLPSDREIRLILLAREFANRYDPLILDDMIALFLSDYDITSEEKVIFCNELNRERYAG